MTTIRSIFVFLHSNVDLDTAINCLMTCASEPDWFSIGDTTTTIAEAAKNCVECDFDDELNLAALTPVMQIAKYINNNDSHGELISMAVDAFYFEWDKVNEADRETIVVILQHVLAKTADHGVDH